MAIQWSKHALNIRTGEMIWRQPYKSGSVYKVKSRLFTEFKKAVNETADFGNARREYLIIKALWPSAKGSRFMVYSYIGELSKKFKEEKQAIKIADALTKARPETLSESLSDRIAAWEKDREEYLQYRKRKLIEREKEKLLQDRAANVLARRVEKRQAENAEFFSQSDGSW